MEKIKMPKSITTKNKKAIGIIIITIIGLAIVISQSSIQFRNNVLLAHYSKTPLKHIMKNRYSMQLRVISVFIKILKP